MADTPLMLRWTPGGWVRNVRSLTGTLPLALRTCGSPQRKTEFGQASTSDRPSWSRPAPRSTGFAQCWGVG